MSYTPDPAAIFGAALSLRSFVHKRLPEAYEGEGFDGLTRDAMDAAARFESWACSRVDFESLVDVWPYLLEDTFAECLSASGADLSDLRRLGPKDWEGVAVNMGLTLNEVWAKLEGNQ